MKNLAAVLLALIAAGAAAYQLSRAKLAVEEGQRAEARAEAAEKKSQANDERVAALGWPPKQGEAYPDLDLIDQDGQAFKLSDLRGSVVLIETVGMPCAACQAFSGAHEVGSYGGAPIQQGLESFEKLFPRYSRGVPFVGGDFAFVQIIFYGLDKVKPGEAGNWVQPRPEDAAGWAKHFGFHKSRNQIVAVPREDLRNGDTFRMIPGFQLLDKKGVLRSDGTGRRPATDPFTHTVPMVSKLLKE